MVDALDREQAGLLNQMKTLFQDKCVCKPGSRHHERDAQGLIANAKHFMNDVVHDLEAAEYAL